MIAEVKLILDRIVGNVTHLENAKGHGREFELYLMSGIVAELLESELFPGLEVCILRSDGTPIEADHTDRVFVQRVGSPSGLPDPNEGTDDMSTLLVSLANAKDRQWEFWNGVQFVGRSGGTHEFDIAVVPHDVGRELRASYTDGRPVGRPDVAIECKHVKSKAVPDDVRAFIARLYDCTLLESDPRPAPYQEAEKTSIHPITLDSHRASQGHADANRLTLNIIAHKTGFSTGAEALTKHYRIHPCEAIGPGTPAATELMNSIANWIYKKLLTKLPNT